MSQEKGLEILNADQKVHLFQSITDDIGMEKGQMWGFNEPYDGECGYEDFWKPSKT